MRKSNTRIEEEKKYAAMGLREICIGLAIHTDGVMPKDVVRLAGDYFSYITGDIFHSLSGTIAISTVKATPIIGQNIIDPKTYNGVTPVAKGKNKPKKEVKKPSKKQKAKATKSPVVLAK